jgi:hypothetical protein
VSIVRWIKQAEGRVSDVYIYHDVNGGITCHSAIDMDRDFNKETPEEVIAHLKVHFKDHQIPDFVFERKSYEY